MQVEANRLQPHTPAERSNGLGDLLCLHDAIEFVRAGVLGLCIVQDEYRVLAGNHG